MNPVYTPSPASTLFPASSHPSVSFAVTPPYSHLPFSSDSDSEINAFNSTLTPASASVATLHDKDQVPFESISLNMLKIESDEIGATVKVKEEILDSSQFERKGLIEPETEEIGPMTLSKAKGSK